MPIKCFATFSMNTQVMSNIWTALKYDLDLNHWRAVFKEDMVASVFAATNEAGNEFRYHHVLSNAFTCPVPVESGTQFECQSQTPSSTMKYKMDYLDGLKKKELINLCKQNSLKIGGKKEELVNRLFKSFGVDPELQSKFENAVKEHKVAKWKANDIVHEVYKRNFNLVDIFNKRWYKFEFKYRVMQWRAKLFLSILKIGLINSWTLSLELGKSKYFAFRNDLLCNLAS